MEKKPIKIIIELIVVSVAITSGIHFISTIIRNRYYGFLETIEIDPGVMHVLDYLGHLAFLAVMIGYAFAVPSHRKYSFPASRVMHGKMCDEGVPGIRSVNRRILITNR